MNFRRAVVLIFGSLMIGIWTLGALANSELDNEIDSLQVQLVKTHAQRNRNHTAPKKYTYKKPAVRTVARPRAVLHNNNVVVSHEGPGAPPAVPRIPVYAPPAPPPVPQAPVQAYDTSISNNDSVGDSQPVTPPAYSDDSEISTSRMSLRPVEDNDDHGDGFLYRVSLVPSASISTFDGGNSSEVIPSGVSNPLTAAPSVTLLTDLNLLGLQNFVLETGADYIQTGSQTGFAFEPWMSNYSYNERVTLSYAGVPINAKWMAKGEHVSTFFAKIGVNPVFLMNHQYTAYSGFNEEFRFGGYGTMDVLLTAGVGYSIRVGRHYQIVVDLEGYQGTIPVLSTYNVFNVGGTAGVGLSYTL